MPHDWQETSPYGTFAATRGQKQLITLGQLQQSGLSASGVRSRLERGHIFRIHAGVYAIHPPPYSRHQLYLAAVFAGGPGSALSDLPAAAVLGIYETSPLPAHITNSSGRGRSVAGIVVHRRDLEPRDMCVRHGIPCTTPARTILDCSRILGAEEMLMAADSMRILNRRRLEELIARHGSRHLRTLLTDGPGRPAPATSGGSSRSAARSASPSPRRSTGSSSRAAPATPTSAGRRSTWSSKPTPGAGTAGGSPRSQTATAISSSPSPAGGWCTSPAIRYS